VDYHLGFSAVITTAAKEAGMHLIATTVPHLVTVAKTVAKTVVKTVFSLAWAGGDALHSFVVMIPVLGPIFAFSFRHPIVMFIFCPVTLFVSYAVVSDLRKQARDPAYAAQRAREQAEYHQERLARKAIKKARQHTTPHINIGRFMQC
jgi:hypothetical protein